MISKFKPKTIKANQPNEIIALVKKERKYYICNEPGHFAKECPDKVCQKRKRQVSLRKNLVKKLINGMRSTKVTEKSTLRSMENRRHVVFVKLFISSFTVR